MKISVSPNVPGSISANLPIRHIPQEQTKWCWAASAQMVLEYRGQTVKQCDIAEQLLKKKCCPKLATCNVMCNSLQVDQIYNHFGINNQYLSGNLSFGDIQAEINANRPIEVGLSWNQGGGHLAIISGWEQDTSGEWVRVNDPDPTSSGPGVIRYTSLLQAYGYGNWVESWTNLT